MYHHCFLNNDLMLQFCLETHFANIKFCDLYAEMMVQGRHSILTIFTIQLTIDCRLRSTSLRFSAKKPLKYLTAHKLIMHYSEVLPEVVFINSQVILDKITELVEHSLTLRAKLPTQVRAARSVRGSLFQETTLVSSR